MYITIDMGKIVKDRGGIADSDINMTIFTSLGGERSCCNFDAELESRVLESARQHNVALF